ncbi:MAG: ArsR family transcriptional regulator [Thermoplasmatales archaeon]|nr:ArsR family transcriptional regulator [Thermoplasmatales archaeon]
MKKEGIIKLKTRKLIYNYILKHPGLHFRELSRELKIPKSTLDYHLSFLKKLELIKVKSNGRYNRYYAMKQVGRIDKEIINVLRQEVPLKLVIHLLVDGPGDIYKSKKTFWKAMDNPSARTKLFSVKDLVELEKYWNWDKGDLYKLNKSRSTIDFHLNKLLNADIIEKIRVGKEIKYKLKDNLMIYFFLVENNKVLSNELIDIMMASGNDGRLLKYYTKKAIDTLWEIFPHPYHV